jgi:hypothetical protein
MKNCGKIRPDIAHAGKKEEKNYYRNPLKEIFLSIYVILLAFLFFKKSLKRHKNIMTKFMLYRKHTFYFYLNEWKKRHL